MFRTFVSVQTGFNPRTYIRYDVQKLFGFLSPCGFNPRTYIRYDFLLI